MQLRKPLDSVAPKPAETLFLIGTGLQAEIFAPRAPQSFAGVGKRGCKYNISPLGGFVPKFPALHASLVCPSLPTISLLKRRCRNGIFGDLPLLGDPPGGHKAEERGGMQLNISDPSRLLQPPYKKT